MTPDPRSPGPQARRHARVGAALVVLQLALLLLGVAALGGGVMMMTDPSGASLGMDPDLLTEVPWVSDFQVPGLFLTVLLGALPLLVVAGLRWRFRLPGVAPIERALGHEWPLLAAVAQGVGVVVWIGLQLRWLTQTAPVQWVILGVGVSIVLLSLLPAVRGRYRLVA